jgi:hypothetical protein
MELNKGIAAGIEFDFFESDFAKKLHLAVRRDAEHSFSRLSHPLLSPSVRFFGKPQDFGN